MDDWMPDISGAGRIPAGSRRQRWHLKKRVEQDVYFISADPEDMLNAPVKIGISNYPEMRLMELQQTSPARLVLLATCPGGLQRERRYHERFAADRIHGEWFKRSEPLMTLIRWHEVRSDRRNTG